MNNQDFNQIHFSIRRNIQNYKHSCMKGFSAEIKHEANCFIDYIRPELTVLMSNLQTRSVSCFDIQEFLISQADKLNLDFLKSKGTNDDCINEIKNDILRIIASAVLNSFLDSLFRNQKSNNSVEANRFF